MNPLDHVPDGPKHVIDSISVLGIAGVLVGILPHIASFLTIVWFAIRIWETKTVGRLIGRKTEIPQDGD